MAKAVTRKYASSLKADTDKELIDLEGWASLVASLAPELEAEFLASVDRFLEAGATLNSDSLLTLDQEALDYAQARAAELVGKQMVDGNLIDNPNPRWAITDSTRAMIRKLIEQAYAEGWAPGKLAREIASSAAFSRDRARTVARTELALANVNGGMNAAVKAGATTKKWVINPDSPTALIDPCGANARQGYLGIGHAFLSGDIMPPQHPNCECTLVFGFRNSE